MLRSIALSLLLANAAYFAWGQGLLAAYGLAPARHSEPERLAQQIRPEALQLVRPDALQAAAIAAVPPAPPASDASDASAAPPEPAASAASAAPAAPAVPAVPAVLATGVSCLQVGMFTERQARALRSRLRASLPKDSWSFESSGDSVRWIIYMGKYVSQAAMNRKRQMLDQLGLPFEPPLSPLLNPGLSLGSFASRTKAEEALAQMNQRGLRSAKVMLERPELPSLWLRLPAADAAMQSQLEALKPHLADKAVQACA